MTLSCPIPTRGAACLLGAALLLAGCDNSSSWSRSFNSSFREKYIETCVAEASQRGKARGLQKTDWTGVCTCMADQMLAASPNPVRLLLNANDDAQIDAAAKKCV